jgi:hypothetical protein
MGEGWQHQNGPGIQAGQLRVWFLVGSCIFLFRHYTHIGSGFHGTRIQWVPWVPSAGLKQAQHEDGHLSNFHLLKTLETNTFLQHPVRLHATHC